MGLKYQAVTGVKWNCVSLGVNTVLQFITLTVLVRLLSPSDFGLIGMIMVVIGFAQLFSDMGISNAIIYRQDATKPELSSLYWLNVMAGISVFLIVCGIAPLVSRFYNEPRLGNLIYFSALIFLLTPFGQQFQILLQKDLKFERLAKIEIITVFANSATSIILAILGMGVISLIWGQLASTFLRVLLLVVLSWKKWHPHFHFATKDVKRYLNFGLYQMGEKAINYFNSNFDYLLIGSLLGAESLGYYTLAYQLIIKPVSTINSVISRVAFPVFSRIQHDNQKLKMAFLKILRILSIINYPIYAGVTVVAPIAIPLLLGEKWLPSIILIQILSIVGMFRSTGNPVGSLILSKGRADLGFKWNLAITITQIPVLYFGAKIGGSVGVTTALVALQCLYSIFNYLILIRILLGPCLREYLGSIWPALWMSWTMAAAVFFTRVFFQNSSALHFLVTQIFFGVSIYLCLMWYKQKNLIIQIKNMIFNKGFDVV